MGIFANVTNQPSGAAQVYADNPPPPPQPSALSRVGEIADLLLTGGMFHALNQRSLQQRLYQTQNQDLQSIRGMFTPPSTTTTPDSPLPNPQDWDRLTHGQYGPAPTQTFGGPNVVSTPGHIPTVREAAPALARAASHGVSVEQFLNLIKEAKPAYQAVNGTLVDTNQPGLDGKRIGTSLVNVNNRMVDNQDPNNANLTVPQVDKGQVVNYDARGVPIGVANLPGNVAAQADVAGGVTSAQEGAKAGYDLVDVPLAGGQTIKMPRIVAAPLLAGAAKARLELGGGGPVDATDLGVSQSPAEAELARQRAGAQGTREADKDGSRAAMQQVDDQTNMIRQNLHDMLGETQDPHTGKWVKTNPSMINGYSSGSATPLLEHIPVVGQAAQDLAAKIETVRNGTSFNSMQAIKNAMAAAGNGSGASIRMTDQIGKMLGEINGSLSQTQSGPQFESTVRRHLSQLDALDQARHDLFESQYKNIETPTPGSTAPKAPAYDKNAPSRDALMTEARRRGLIH